MNNQDINGMIKKAYINELNTDITDLTTKIYSDFPELYINLEETPLGFSSSIHDIGLQYQYLESLKVLYQSFLDSAAEKQSK